MNFREPISYYTPADHADLAVAPSYRDVYIVVERVLMRMPDRLTVVCGPISSGGGKIEDNIKRFNNAIMMLARYGVNVFSQLPLENALRRIIAEDPAKDGLCLLEAIYLPLFSHKKVCRQCFIDGWQHSFGATWEHELGRKLFLLQEYFHPDFETLPLGASPLR